MRIWLFTVAFVIASLASLLNQDTFAQKAIIEPLSVAEVVKVSPSEKSNFFWDYFIYVPRSLSESTNESQKKHFLVVPNNTGTSDDNIEVHNEYAKKDIAKFIKLAEQLKVVLLEPVFPRPKTKEQWKIYTHALDRDTLLTKDRKLRRLDLQLISMVDDARQKLSSDGLQTDDKVLMWGFSASGMFVNRFCLLHPTRVLAATIGSPGGWAMLPIKSWNGQKLRYPIGIGDFKKAVKSDFDLEAVKQLKLYFFLGDQDTNDSVVYRDSYDKEDEKLIFRNFGSNLITRWQTAEKIYKEAGCVGCQFVIYKGVGHDTNREINNDIRAFFIKALQN